MSFCISEKLRVSAKFLSAALKNGPMSRRGATCGGKGGGGRRTKRENDIWQPKAVSMLMTRVRGRMISVVVALPLSRALYPTLTRGSQHDYIYATLSHLIRLLSED
jgi:hypothetical protein